MKLNKSILKHMIDFCESRLVEKNDPRIIHYYEGKIDILKYLLEKYEWEE